MTRPIALITGASRGLGYALGAELGARDWHVIAVARTQGGLEELDDAIQAAGGAATLVPADLTDDAGAEHLGRALFERFGQLDLWLHTAIHATPLSPAPAMDAKDFDKALAVNTRMTQRLIRVLDPLLVEGEAIFFDDPAAGRFHAAYAATKAAQMALADTWRAERQALGRHTRIVTPPPMPTAVRARAHPGEDRSRLTSTTEAARRILSEVLAD